MRLNPYYTGAIMEIWKVSSLDSSYVVSNLGNVKSCERVFSITRGNQIYSRKFPESKVNGYISYHGYYVVTVTKRKKLPIHRMVAFEFCDGYKDGLCVNHKNGVRTDNRAENLEWVTISENVKHGFSVNGRKIAGKEVTRKCIATGEVKIYSHYRRAKEEGFDFIGIKKSMKTGIPYKSFYWIEAKQ